MRKEKEGKESSVLVDYVISVNMQCCANQLIIYAFKNGGKILQTSVNATTELRLCYTFLS